jgi:Mn2+/Fe2+ NRAMP family transporter
MISFLGALGVLGGKFYFALHNLYLRQATKQLLTTEDTEGKTPKIKWFLFSVLFVISVVNFLLLHTIYICAKQQNNFSPQRTQRENP